MSKKERIDKILSNMGYGSRKDVKKKIKNGIVTVDGKIIKNNSFKVNPYDSKIKIGRNVVKYREYVYIMLNKPDGFVSSTYDPINTTVIELLDEKYKIFDPFPIGRLDKDTEGLLILSNDGKLAHNILSPNKHVDKTYYVEVKGKVTKEDILKFKEGVYIEEDYKTKPADLEILTTDDISKVNLTIREGKFHQVKRMFKAVDKEVIYLKRVKMGKLCLDEDLNLGEYRELNKKEIELLSK
ncbi:MAG: rRNA pseudouridine synthase [Firmicutes bacterium]|nr:rRNA pseudouridine synthase [Bacillota bacterium]